MEVDCDDACCDRRDWKAGDGCAGSRRRTCDVRYVSCNGLTRMAYPDGWAAFKRIRCANRNGKSANACDIALATRNRLGSRNRSRCQ